MNIDDKNEMSINNQNYYFATVARGLEEIAAKELERLGASAVKVDFTGVHFQGDKELLYRVNLWSRIIFRVLQTIDKIPSADAEQLYQGIHDIDWNEYVKPEQTLAVNCTGGNRNLNHSHFTALQVKNAIVDRQFKDLGNRSDIDPENPDILVNVHIRDDNCTVSLDSSGESLHRRGYRPAMGLAPLKETLAAAILELTDWQSDLAFLDPLCGSGTLPIEAGMKALKIAPRLYRQRFGFQNWQNYDLSLWNSIVKTSKEGELSSLSQPIVGSDRDPEIIAQARENAAFCDLDREIKFQQLEVTDIQPPAAKGVIICNPPYGKRIGDVEELTGFYRLLGDIFKQRFTGWTAYILTGNKELSKQVGLKAARRFPLYNGSIPCTLLKYELY
jgi:putative N6-adenine-specific DNA methylase